MSRHEERYEKCSVCGKKVYPTWTEATKSAKSMVRLSGKAQGVVPYFSRECRAIHVGQSTNHKHRKMRRGR